MRTLDPVRDASRRDEAFEDWLKTRPVCCVCGHPITEGRIFRIGWTKAPKYIGEFCCLTDVTDDWE